MSGQPTAVISGSCGVAGLATRAREYGVPLVAGRFLGPRAAHAANQSLVDFAGTLRSYGVVE